MSRLRSQTLLSPRLLAAAVLLVTAALLTLAGCNGEPPSRGDVLVKLDGEELRYADFQSYVEQNVDHDADGNVDHGDGEGGDGAEHRRGSLESSVLSRLFDQFLEERLLVRLAHERGLAKDQASQRAAVDFLIQAVGEPQVGESAIAAYYESHRDEFERPEQVQLRQILVRDAKIAGEAREAVLAGEDFATVAVRTSEEPQAERGGDQGLLGRGDLPPAFADVIFNLSPGEVSDIVAADYGYHLFQVVERRPAQLVSLAEAHEQIREKLQRQLADELIAGFVKTAKETYHVEVFPSHFPFDYQGAYAG